MSRWSFYRRSLVLSMGLSPLVLAGCDHAEPDFGTDADMGILNTLPAAELAPPITLSGDAPVTGTFLQYTASGLTPGSTAWLAASRRTGAGICPPVLGGLCLDIVDEQFLGAARANANGDAVFDVELPYDMRDGRPVRLQAASAGATSNVLQGTTSHTPRACAEVPFVDPNNWQQLGEGFVCRDLPPSGICEAASSLTSRESRDMLEDAIQRPTRQGAWGVDHFPFCLETTIETACCYNGYVEMWIAGRPYSVDGAPRFACEGEMADWAASVSVEPSELPPWLRQHLAQRWADAARGEHASVASFARFALHLAQVGAPADLVADTAAAMADEIRHARDAFGIAVSLDADVGGPGAMDTSTPAMDTEAIVLAAVREGCISETIAAAQAAAAAQGCRNEVVRDILTGVAADEQRHAGLAWRFVRWALQTYPELRPQVEAVFAELPTFEPVAAGPLDSIDKAWGLLPEADMRMVAMEVLADVVQPCAARLLGASTDQPSSSGSARPPA